MEKTQMRYDGKRRSGGEGMEGDDKLHIGGKKKRMGMGSRPMLARWITSTMDVPSAVSLEETQEKLLEPSSRAIRRGGRMGGGVIAPLYVLSVLKPDLLAFMDAFDLPPIPRVLNIPTGEVVEKDQPIYRLAEREAARG